MSAERNICPHCQAINTGEVSGSFLCNKCGASLICETKSASADQVAEVEPPLAERIGRYSRLRRSLIRTSSYYLIAAIGASVGFLQVLWLSIRPLTEGDWLILSAYYAVAILLLRLSSLFWRKYRNIAKELSRARADELSLPPDFSQLSDGSQHVRNLERLK